MRLRLRVVPRAEREIRQASDWWRRHRSSVAERFGEELARGFELITTQPEIAPRSRDAEMTDVRRLHLFRIRHYLYYRIREDLVEVLALWHTSRGHAPRLG